MILDKFNKPEVIAALIQRDGYVCTYPKCEADYSPIPDHKKSITIDHTHPQARARQDGWSEDEINHISNLQLMHKECNARKSDLIYNEDGTLPTRGTGRAVKAERPHLCDLCMNGRLLLPDETCPLCYSDPQPKAWPTSMQKSPKECDHRVNHCWMCLVHEPDLRAPAYEDVFGIPDLGVSNRVS